MVIPAGDSSDLPVLLRALPPVDEVIVVVGRGEDTTRALPRSPRVIRQTRSGAGNALACGVDASTGDIVVTLPGDGSCDPAEMPRLLAALREGADVVHGSRYLSGRPGVLDRVLLWFLRVLFDCRPSDPGHGYRAFWRDSAARLGLPVITGFDPVRGDGPEIEALLAVRIATSGLHGAEVPTTVHPRVAGTPLLTAARALVAEYAARRRATRAGAPESIVVLTGRAPLNPPHHRRGGLSHAAGGSPTTATPHTAGASRAAGARSSGAVGAPDGRSSRAAGDSASVWPAPNRRRTTASADLPNSGLLPGDRGFTERRRGDRRPADRTRVTGNADLPFAGRGRGKPQLDPAENLTRRRWRDQGTRNTGSARPNLRVINGEGAGPSPRRNDHLRSV
ncbi:glycosyltransferase [Actinoplanes missouriensis]|uniref:glycosyltransferase n=1 Tax=Actinoplanes missouriensis TaxID=1866 RepID=UPI0033D6E79B